LIYSLGETYLFGEINSRSWGSISIGEISLKSWGGIDFLGYNVALRFFNDDKS